MGGSRKGEHRGNAKKRLDGAPPKPTQRQMTVRMPSRQTEEYLHMVNLVVNPGSPEARETRPKEAMLEIQSFFLDRFRMLRQFGEQLQEAQRGTTNAKLRQELETQIIFNEQLMVLEAMRVKEAAKDVAPYMHPKLGAVHVTSNTDGDPLTQLIEQIGDANKGKPTWMHPNLKLISNQ